MSDKLSRKKLFYYTLTPFIIFFAFYGFFLYPNRDWLSPHQTADWMVSILGEERSHWVLVFRYWMDSLFFLMAEFWGGVVILVLYWGFLNQISSINEASRFYTLLSAGGHIGVIASGPLIWYYASSFSKDEYGMTVQYLMSIVVIVCLLIMATYWWINRYVVEGKVPVAEKSSPKKPKVKLSLRESLTHVVCNPALGCIVLMVIGYGLSVNMVEVAWKGILKVNYPDSNDYQAFMGIVSFCTGIVSLILALVISGNVIRKFGWHVGAQSTPVILGLASLAFYLSYFASGYASGAPIVAGSASLMLIVICGAVHNIACKSMKYCLFDPTKEMAYIPLPDDIKVKGKAAVDVVGARFGKSGSSWIQVALMEIVGMGSILSIIPYLAPVVLLAIAGWSTSVYLLNRKSTKTFAEISFDAIKIG